MLKEKLRENSSQFLFKCCDAVVSTFIEKVAWGN